MRRSLICLTLIGLVILGAVHLAGAATQQDAKELAEKAVQYWASQGKEKAIAEFNNQKGSFVKGDLYVVVLDFNGLVLAHGGNPVLTGINLLPQKDATSNKLFVKEQIEIAKTKGSGWTSYTWTNPVTKKVQLKKSWVQRIESTDSYVVCGVFQ